MYSILAVGSAALDTIETSCGKVDDCIGGSALYFAAGASLFAPVSVVSVIGNDFPISRLDFLRQRNVDLAHLEVAEGQTFRWGGRYDRDFISRETLFTALNTFEKFSPVIPPRLVQSDLVFLGNILPELQLSVLNQIARPRFVLLDTIRLWIETHREALQSVLERVDAVVLNDEEIRLLSGIADIPKAVRKVMEWGPALVIVKRGEHGATMHHRDGWMFALPAIPVDGVIDPTGAGDSFAGGFLGRLAVEQSLSQAALRRALVSGTIVASFTVQAFGLDKLATVTPVELASREKMLLDAIRIP